MLSISDLKKRAGRLWPRILAADVTGEMMFPFAIGLAPPRNNQLAEQFKEVRRWIHSLEDLARKHALEIVGKEINHRILGRQHLPGKIVFPDRDTLLKFIGRTDDYRRFTRNVMLLRNRIPELCDWLPTGAQEVDAYGAQWAQLLDVVRFLQEHPRPHHYPRELDIPGVDSKFIESHRRILRALLDEALPDDAVNRAFAAKDNAGFCRRYGLRFDQPLVRFRWLDESLARQTMGLADISAPIEQFSELNPDAGRVFITENKINGLSFPPVEGALVIFGLGYGVELLAQAPWLRDKTVYYWGDIDTHGLHILDRLRQTFPRAVSMLMDEHTLLSNREFWGSEPPSARFEGPLQHLRDNERDLYQSLLNNRYGKHIRMEQERIPFRSLHDFLLAL